MLDAPQRMLLGNPLLNIHCHQHCALPPLLAPHPPLPPAQLHPPLLTNYREICFTSLVAVGTPVARCPPHRSVRAELLHTAPTADIWRRSARWDGGEESGHWESSDRLMARTFPSSSGCVGFGAGAHDTIAR